MTRNLKNALIAQKRKTQSVIPEIYGTLGIPIGGIRAVEVSGRNSYVYVKLRDNPNEVIQAFNNKVAPSYNLPVVVLREGNRYIVARVNSERYENNWNNSAPYLPAHGGSHSFPEGGGADVTWMFSRQFMPFLAFPSTYSGTVTISPHVIANPAGNWMYVGNTGTASLLGYMPTGTDQSIMVLVYMDSRTGNPGYLVGSGTPFSNNVTGTQNIYRHVPPLSSPSTQIPIVAVRINTGTTGVGWDNLYDMRQWLHATPSGTSGGGGSGVDTLGFAGLSDGVPIGTGTALNVHGAVFTRSGTVFDLNIPTSTQGISIYNDGSFVATGTSISFNTNVSVIATGTSIFVDFPVTTYFRVGQPSPLGSPTGLYWRVPDGVFATGSLGVFIQGHALIPGIDYTEQIGVSGTFQYATAPPTGTYHLVHYGVPCTSYITLQTSPFALTDSDGNLLTDSDGNQLTDSDG